MSPLTSEPGCYYTQVTVEETEVQKRGRYIASPKAPRPRANLHVNPTSFQLQIPCCMGGSRILAEQTLPLSKRTRNGRREAVEKQEASCYTLGKTRGEGSHTRAKRWQRSLEQLWSSAVWKTSDFVVLMYNDNKSQLPHSVDSHRPPPKIDKQAWGWGFRKEQLPPKR